MWMPRHLLARSAGWLEIRRLIHLCGTGKGHGVKIIPQYYTDSDPIRAQTQINANTAGSCQESPCFVMTARNFQAK